jgi:glycosyltransferase involved in cell wall biosynthesis
MSDNLSISVIMPVYNGEKYLKEAIDSILDQSYKSFEIILIDDGSNDSTAEIAKTYKEDLIYLYQENKGIAASRNRGISEAKGEYISFLDADNIWIQNKLQKQKEKLFADSSIDMIFGMIEHFYSPDTDEIFRRSVRCPSEPLQGIDTNTVLIKRSTFLQVGLFSTNYKIGEFIEWHARAQENGFKEYCIPEVLLRRRIHHNNYTLINKDVKNDYARIIKDMLIRRKNKNS